MKSKSFKNKFFASTFLSLILAAFVFLLSTPLVFAQSTQTTKQRCDAFKSQFQLNKTTNIIPTQDIFCSGSAAALWVIKLLIGFSGTVTIIFLIFGGYLYLTSGGNDEQAEKGKKVLINSVIGLIVIVMSTAIVTIVTNTLTSK